MDLKFYLNKIIKIDNIEHYSLESLLLLKKSYDNFLEKTGGVDPDYPLVSQNNKGTKIKGTNISQILGEEEP